jgi:hypothetical protein
MEFSSSCYCSDRRRLKVKRCRRTGKFETGGEQGDGGGKEMIKKQE